MVSALIVAAGKGERMNWSVRKQYIPINSRPVIGHTLAVADACHGLQRIYLVIPEQDLEYCRNEIIPPLMLHKKVVCVAGGAERQISVYNGLKAMGGAPDDIVVIHDGVRPLIEPDHIQSAIDGASKWGACILGIPAFDTLKRVDDSGFIQQTIERSAIWMAQTPQAFRYGLIFKAHEQAAARGLTATDDASLVESAGITVKMVCGSRFNIKITTQEDLMMAKALLQIRGM